MTFLGGRVWVMIPSSWQSLIVWKNIAQKGPHNPSMHFLYVHVYLHIVHVRAW